MAFRSASTNSGNGTAISTPKPAGAAVDDIAILKVSTDVSGKTLPAPTGFTAFTANGQASPDGQSNFAYWRRLDGGEGANFTHTVSGGGDDWVSTCELYSGRHTTDPPVATLTTPNTSSNASAISCALTGVTAVSGDDISAWVALDKTASAPTWTFTPPTNYTEASDQNNGWCAASGAYRENVGSGATGSLTFTATAAGASAGYAGYVIRIPAAAGGGGGTVNDVVLDDSISVGDATVLSAVRTRIMADSFSITDEALASFIGSNILAKILTSAVDVTDGALLSAIRGAVLQDTIIISEGATDQFINTNLVADDAIEITDEYLARLIWLRVLGDSIGITDEALAAVIGQNILVKVLTSSITTTDEALFWLNRFRTGESAVLTSDQIVQVLRFTRELSDAIDMADGVLTAMQRFVMLTDALTVDDSLSYLFITPTTVEPVVVIGFDQPNIKIGGHALA